MGELMVLMRDVEQCFGGDAAYIEAGTSKCASLLDADGIESELRCLDCSHVA